MNLNRIRSGLRSTCRWAILGMVVAGMAGCQPDGGRQLSGKWKLDAEQSLAERMGTQEGSVSSGGSSAEAAPFEGEVDPNVPEPEVTITFRSNGVLETLTRTGIIDSTKSGSWRLVSYDSGKMTAVVECILNQQVTEHEIQWLDEDSIKMTPPNMAGLTMKLIFRRAD